MQISPGLSLFLLRLQDPYNNSSIAIYVNPLMKKMVQGEPTKLCTNEFLATYQMTNHASPLLKEDTASPF